jgi:hypothetical protein
MTGAETGSVPYLSFEVPPSYSQVQIYDSDPTRMAPPLWKDGPHASSTDGFLSIATQNELVDPVLLEIHLNPPDDVAGVEVFDGYLYSSSENLIAGNAVAAVEHALHVGVGWHHVTVNVELLESPSHVTIVFRGVSDLRPQPQRLIALGRPLARGEARRHAAMPNRVDASSVPPNPASAGMFPLNLVRRRVTRPVSISWRNMAAYKPWPARHSAVYFEVRPKRLQPDLRK